MSKVVWRVRLYDHPGDEPIQLRRIAHAESDHLTDLRFQPTNLRRTS